jgi:hypothetical protein
LRKLRMEWSPEQISMTLAKKGNHLPLYQGRQREWRSPVPLPPPIAQAAS